MRRVSSRAFRAASRACAASTTLPTTIFASCGCSSNHVASISLTRLSTDRAHLGRDELVLRLRGEFRVRHLDREHAGQALAAIIAGEIDLLALGEAGALGIARHLPRQRRAQAGEVGAAITLGDVVGEGQHILMVGIVPPECDLDGDTIALALDENGRADQRRLGAIEIAHEGLKTALVEKLLLLISELRSIGQFDPHAGIEECQFAQPVLDRRKIEFDHGEGLWRRQEGDFRAALALPSTIGAGPTTASGATTSPLAKSTTCSRPSRQMRSFSKTESALTTETPTPCRPPETL